ncbi:CaiB/BaiF CoA transferase family protein [Chloroflexota bacterium]
MDYPESRKQVLEGLKIADFSWVIAGPLITRCLANFGATVIRVESMQYPETIRLSAPFPDGVPGINRSGLFASLNVNKYSISVNMHIEAGREVARKLVAWSDVVVESFTPGTMERWGLGFEDLKKIRPDIIMLSTSTQGHTGPSAKQRALGYHLNGMAGIINLVGWPDREPAALPAAYTDYITPSLGVATVISALDYRSRTCKGLYIDLSQMEVALSLFFSPTILDYVINKHEWRRMGNRSAYASPQGVYRCRGEERYCAITVFKDDEWKAVCELIGDTSLAEDARFETLLARKENEDELDRLIEEWTINFTPEQVAGMMQARGVAAGVVESNRDKYEDPQLKYRNYFWKQNHPELGSIPVFGEACRLSKTPATLRKHAPCLGEDTTHILTQLLGYSDNDLVRLVNEKAIE